MAIIGKRRLPPNKEPSQVPNYEAVWQPFPNSSQELAMTAPVDVLFMHGTRGSAKTETQLMKYYRHVGKGFGIFWKGIIFDREYKNLDDIITRANRLFPMFDDGAKFLSSTSALKWIWPTGEELLFRSAKDEKDYQNYHGHEYPWIGVNEVTKYPTSAFIDRIMSTNRSSYKEEFNAPIDPNTGERVKTGPIPLEAVYTTNSYGPGIMWCKRRYINVAPNGVIHRREVEVFDPQTQQEVTVVKTQVALFSSWRENTRLDKAYIAQLAEIEDEALKASWYSGSWEIVAGGALADVWNPKRQIKRRFVIPAGWYVDRAMDWGSSHPAWIGWFAEANGEEATIVHPDGMVEKFAPPAGSLVLFHEWYLTKEVGTNKGLKLGSEEVAQGILDIEEALIHHKWVITTIYAGPADNQIRDTHDDSSDTIAKKMEDKGVYWESSDKSAGSRKIGLQLFRDRLTAAAKGEGKALYFMDHCVAAIETVPLLQRDKKHIDDVDTNGEDHPYDGIRYRLLAADGRMATAKVKFPG